MLKEAARAGRLRARTWAAPPPTPWALPPPPPLPLPQDGLFKPWLKKQTSKVTSTLKLWDAATGAEKRTLEGHTGPVKWFAFSPDGSRLVSGSGVRARARGT